MLDTLINVIDRVLSAVGRMASLLVLVVIAVIVLEMFTRGVLGHSLSWAHELSGWLLTAFVFLGGPYALLRGKFVRVDVFYLGMSARTKALVDTLISTVLLAALLAVLFWLGGRFFLSSYAVGEVSATGSWGGPVWAAKAMLPLGAALLAIAWIGHLLRLWRDALHGPVSTHPDERAKPAETRDLR